MLELQPHTTRPNDLRSPTEALISVMKALYSRPSPNHISGSSFFWKRVWEISIMSSLDVSWNLSVKLSELGGLYLQFFKELNNISGEGPLVLSSSLRVILCPLGNL